MAVALLCGTAGRAFADGIPFPSEGALITMLIVFAALVIGGLYLVIRVLVALARAVEAASAKRKARAAEPAVPAARIVKDSLKGSDPPS
ncbi:MAG TPA: hypothetical protein VF469_31295 [Kofleriaceae bacterium]